MPIRGILINMSTLELEEHNIIVYRNDPDYIKACLNIGMGVLACVQRTKSNSSFGLKIVHRVSNISTLPLHLLEFDINLLSSPEESGFYINDIKYVEDFFYYTNMFNSYRYYIDINNKIYSIRSFPIGRFKV